MIKEPLWTSGMFGGMPDVPNQHLAYPNNLMQKLDNIMNLRGILPHPIGSMFLLFVGMCILLSNAESRSIQRSRCSIWIHDVYLLLHCN
jgi:hypothetical protein